jgi:hypothetical protein
LRLEALLGAILDRVAPTALGQLVELIARDDDSQIESRLAARTWHHDGLRAFVRELAERLQPEFADEQPELGSNVPSVDERARAALTVMDWSTVPVEVASELAYRLAYLCRVTRGHCFCGYHRSEVCE